MRIEPAVRSKADYEGLYRVTSTEDGISWWLTWAELDARRVRVSAFVDLVQGPVIEGLLDGRPVEEIVRVKESKLGF